MACYPPCLPMSDNLEYSKHNVKGLQSHYYRDRDHFEVDDEDLEFAALVSDMEPDKADKGSSWASRSRDPHDGHG